MLICFMKSVTLIIVLQLQRIQDVWLFIKRNKLLMCNTQVFFILDWILIYFMFNFHVSPDSFSISFYHSKIDIIILIHIQFKIIIQNLNGKNKTRLIILAILIQKKMGERLQWQIFNLFTMYSLAILYYWEVDLNVSSIYNLLRPAIRSKKKEWRKKWYFNHWWSWIPHWVWIKQSKLYPT